MSIDLFKFSILYFIFYIALPGSHVYAKDIAVTFEYGNTHEEAREIVVNHLIQRNKKSVSGGAEPDSVNGDKIGIFLYDLDNDGQKEILCYMSDYCGNAGCAFEILKKVNKIEDSSDYQPIKWKNKGSKSLNSFLIVPRDYGVKILSSEDNKPHDISIKRRKEDTSWKWENGGYTQDKTIPHQ